MFIDPVIETVFIEHTVCQTGGAKRVPSRNLHCSTYNILEEIKCIFVKRFSACSRRNKKDRPAVLACTVGTHSC